MRKVPGGRGERGGMGFGMVNRITRPLEGARSVQGCARWRRKGLPAWTRGPGQASRREAAGLGWRPAPRPPREACDQTPP